MNLVSFGLQLDVFGLTLQPLFLVAIHVSMLKRPLVEWLEHIFTLRIVPSSRCARAVSNAAHFPSSSKSQRDSLECIKKGCPYLALKA